MKVYKILTNITVYQNDTVDSWMSFQDKYELAEAIESTTVYNYDLIENDIITPFIICESKFIFIIKSIVEKYNITFLPVDITKEFLYGKIHIPDDDFVNYRKLNLTEDIVFDKINELGADSLDDLDKKILHENL
jgi:hypothetical protein